MQKTLRLLGLASGVMASMLFYGIAQERIMTRPYGGNDDRFQESAFLVLCNRIVAALLALCAAWIAAAPGNDESLRPAASVAAYAGVSLSNIAATYCQYEALKFVSFPAQTLGKTCKMIAVMALGVLFHGKRYSLRDVGANVLITAGCTAFLLGGDVSSTRGASSTGRGVALMGAFIFADGFTSTLQEWLFRGHRMSPRNQMLYVNLCSACVSTALLVVTGGLFRALAFVAAHPLMLRDAFLLSLCAASGQLCIYSLIHGYGAIVYAGVMVVRQVVSIVLSCIIYGHPLTPVQILSAVIVFSVLGGLEWRKSRAKKVRPSTTSKPKAKKKKPAAIKRKKTPLPLTIPPSDTVAVAPLPSPSTQRQLMVVTVPEMHPAAAQTPSFEDELEKSKAV